MQILKVQFYLNTAFINLYNVGNLHSLKKKEYLYATAVHAKHYMKVAPWKTSSECLPSWQP